MLKHFKLIETRNDYNNNVNQLPYPCLMTIKEDEKLEYRTKKYDGDFDFFGVFEVKDEPQYIRLMDANVSTCFKYVLIDGVEYTGYLSGRGFSDKLSVGKHLCQYKLVDTQSQIPERAFLNCSEMVEAICTKTKLGSECFKNCVNLTSVTFQESVLFSIFNNSIFDGCSSLKQIICNSNKEVIFHDSTFTNIPENGVFYYPIGQKYEHILNYDLLGRFNWTKEAVKF